MTAPATMPALDGSCKASAEGVEGGMEKMGGGKEKELMAVFKEVLLGFGRGIHRSSGVVSVLW